jgi:hypothetical protein
MPKLYEYFGLIVMFYANRPNGEIESVGRRSKPLSPCGRGVGERGWGEGGMEQLKFAKYLRHRMTESETMLWRHLRAHRLNGEKFRRVVACARVQGAAVLEQRNHE